jgi:allantoinase
MSTLIENARILLDGHLVRVNLVVESGKIESVGKRKLNRFDEKIDVKNNFVLPGLVDAHAHLHDPNFMNREDFTSGTAAAAAGGVTTVVEMVLSTPVDTAERVSRKIRLGQEKSLIDFSLHAGMMNLENSTHIGEIARIGVRSFKTFTCKPYYVNDHTLMSLMRETTMHDSILNVHAEDEESANENFQRLMLEKRKDPMAHLEWKSNAVEERAIKKIIGFARDLKARLHISHISTAQAVSLVRKAKRKRVNVTVETCPHYLTFTGKDMKKFGPYLKMNPSLKTVHDLQALWKGLEDGTVDLVTSEHAPGERSEKEIGWEDIWKAWGGVPAIETMLPVLLSEGVNKKRISMTRLQKVCCENPARVFGLFPKKGTIRKGSDADLVIVDLKAKRKVRGSDLHYKVGWTPYEGWMLQGWPLMTICRGKVVFRDDQIIATPGDARFISMFQ